MNRTAKRLIDRAAGARSYGRTGLDRSLRGLRTGDQRELYIGLAFLALAYLQRSAPKKEILFSGRVKEGSAIVVYHRRFGDPKVTIKK